MEQAQTPDIGKGYAVVTREWKPGDRIELELPMEPQRVVADGRIKADKDMVALAVWSAHLQRRDCRQRENRSETERCATHGWSGGRTFSAGLW